MRFQKALGKIVGEIIENKIINDVIEKRSMYNALRNGRNKGVRVITELKFSSPSRKKLRSINKNEIKDIIQEFESGGASAISILVEPLYFKGSFEFLKIARDVTDLPILAKGFFFTPMHLAECAVSGANSFLLMMRVIEMVNQKIEMIYRLGYDLFMDAFIEANTAIELKKALDLNPKIIGVNNRDIYGTLDIQLENVRIGRKIPDNIVFVSASGIENIDDLKTIYYESDSRVDAVLIGSSLMKKKNISRTVSKFVEMGNEVVL